MKTVILFVSIAVLSILPLLLDLIRVSTMKVLSRFSRIVITLSAAFLACIGCTPKETEKPKPRQVHWQGPETGYTGTTTLPPDNADKPLEPQ